MGACVRVTQGHGASSKARRAICVLAARIKFTGIYHGSLRQQKSPKLQTFLVSCRPSTAAAPRVADWQPSRACKLYCYSTPGGRLRAPGRNARGWQKSHAAPQQCLRGSSFCCAATALECKWRALGVLGLGKGCVGFGGGHFGFWGRGALCVGVGERDHRVLWRGNKEFGREGRWVRGRKYALVHGQSLSSADRTLRMPEKRQSPLFKGNSSKSELPQIF